MYCYHCGCRLSEKDFCTNCGADVALYKRIIHMSNRYYNDGLEKANVRDLSGAITSLRQSLKFNKNNIKARNLLGLVYFEMGEVVAALSEWVISKNIRTAKNIADDYLNAIQTNPARLDTINATIRKYNQSLVYCNQDSLDLAVIQLKKVLSLNPKFVRARQLLALIYIHTEEWEKAKRELARCCNVDANNTTTLLYKKEVEQATSVADEKGKPAKREKKEREEVVTYQSGNETIIQPISSMERSGFSSIFNILIGAVIGLAIAWFLVLPARISTAKANINEELKSVSEQSDIKTSTIGELEQQVQSLTNEREELQSQVESYEGDSGTIKASSSLLKAANLYIQEADITEVADALAEIDTESIEGKSGKEFDDLYTRLMEDVGPRVSESYFTSGYSHLRRGDYEEAITDLQKAYEFDNTNVDALFRLGSAYEENDDTDNAKRIYAQLIEEFPDSDRAKTAEDSLAQLNTQ